MKDTSYYFKHDYNSRMDPKIKSVIRKHGYLGFGVFWALIEDLYNQANAMPLNCDDIADDMRVDVALVKSIIFDFDLFVVSEGMVSSKAVQRRLDDRDKKSEKAAENAKKRWEKSKGYPNGMRPHSDGNARKEIREEGDKSNVSTDVDTEKKPTDVGKEADESDVQSLVEAYQKSHGSKTERCISLDEAKDILKSSKELEESVCMKHHLTKAQMDEAIETFIRDKKAEDYEVESEKDVKRHFRNWVPSWLSNFGHPDRSSGYGSAASVKNIQKIYPQDLNDPVPRKVYL